MMYDIFLSHNRFNKPWVRGFYEFLLLCDLKVFFDEESIPPGSNIVKTIEDAIQNSKHVILVLSPESLKSNWVAMELQYSVHLDPNASSGKLVPIIIERVDITSTRLSIKSINCIDLTDQSSFESRLKVLLNHIGIPSDKMSHLKTMIDKLSPKSGGTENELRVGDINTVIEWGWNGERLLDKFIEIDYKTLDNLIESHEGSSQQWGPVFMNHPETWRMLINIHNEIVGYWHFAPLFEEDFDLAKKGLLLDSMITADRIKLFELPGKYNVYFVQICLLETYRRPKNIRLLFESIFTVVDLLSSENIFLNEVCANAYTSIGHSLCKSFNLKNCGLHSEHGSIYCEKIDKIIENSLTSEMSELKARYKKMGLI